MTEGEALNAAVDAYIKNVKDVYQSTFPLDNAKGLEYYLSAPLILSRQEGDPHSLNVIMNELKGTLSRQERFERYLRAREDGCPSYVLEKSLRRIKCITRFLSGKNRRFLSINFKVSRKGPAIAKLTINPLAMSSSPQDGVFGHISAAKGSFIAWCLDVILSRFPTSQNIEQMAVNAFLAAVRFAAPNIMKSVGREQLERFFRSELEVLGTAHNKPVERISSLQKILKVFFGTILNMQSTNLECSDVEKVQAAFYWASMYYLVDDQIDAFETTEKTKEGIMNACRTPENEIFCESRDFGIRIVSRNVRKVREFYRRYCDREDCDLALEFLISSHEQDIWRCSSDDAKPKDEFWELTRIAVMKAASTRLFHLLLCGVRKIDLDIGKLVRAGCVNQIGDDIVDCTDDINNFRRTPAAFAYQNNRIPDLIWLYLSAAKVQQSQLPESIGDEWRYDLLEDVVKEVVFQKKDSINGMEYSCAILDAIAKIGLADQIRARVRQQGSMHFIEPDFLISRIVERLGRYSWRTRGV